MTLSEGISVVICTWNRSASLRATLASLGKQEITQPGNVEVIVVDNNSTDDTKAVVNDFASSWPLGKLIYLFEPRQGKQFALNCGIRSSTRPLLAFTDDDIVFPTDWLSNCLMAFHISANQVIGGSTELQWPASGKPKWFSDEMMAVVGGVHLGDQILSDPPATYAPAGANLVARRSVFSVVGLFSETHFRHMDYEFGMRCRAAGVHVGYDPRIRVVAAVDSAILTRRYFRHWAFKQGIASDDGSTDAPVPAWVYRQLIQDITLLLTRWPIDSTSNTFNRELRVWRRLGQIANYWHCVFSPNSHHEWVAKYSQKKNNISY